MNDRERIGKQIAEARKAKGLSQRKLAELRGINAGYIAHVELGKYSTGIDTLSQICEPLGLKIDLVKK